MQAALVLATTASACNLLNGSGDVDYTTPDAAVDGIAGGDATIVPRADADDTPDAEALPDGPIDAQLLDVAITPDAYVCSGASCFDAGTCDGAPCPVRILGLGQDLLGTIAADNQGVYWTVPKHHTIQRLARTASSPDVLTVVADGTPARPIVDDKGGLYWLETDARRIRKISSGAPAGSHASASRTTDSQPLYLGRSGGGLYLVWGTSAGSVQLGNTSLVGTPDDLTIGEAPILGVGGHVGASFWAVGGADGKLRKESFSLKADLRDVERPTSMITDEQRLYWTTNDTVEWCNGFGTDLVTHLNENEPVGVAVRGNMVYWGSRPNERIRRARNDGSPPVTIAEDPGKPRAIAVNSYGVFWTNLRGEVWALAE